MFFITMLNMLSFLFLIYVFPLGLMGGVLTGKLWISLSLLWFISVSFFFYHSSYWLLQAYHGKKLSVTNRVSSFINLENFFDAKGRQEMPKIYVQNFSELNPFLVFTSKGKIIFLFSKSYYDLLSEESFNSILLASKKKMLIPFWIGSKLLSIRVLFVQFFSFINFQLSKMSHGFLKTIMGFGALFICYLTSPIFLYSAWLYKKTWLFFLEDALENEEITKEAWESLKVIITGEMEMNLLSYFLGTSHSELKGHSLVEL